MEQQNALLGIPKLSGVLHILSSVIFYQSARSQYSIWIDKFQTPVQVFSSLARECACL
jgi:hypothetical protein